ncbi:MAG: 2-polyprenyl-3-methyl-6-methoxy-1,4-benzoquinone monooxygenase [Burkholderiales bacterium]|nr:MAG: 2-polyprenyl-3-methyl-6-methoxy-1,4-benzoquinone monooxygenase [Burkholderiales bacterium]
MRQLGSLDRWLAQADRALATLGSARPSARPVPAPSEPAGASPDATEPMAPVAGPDAGTELLGDDERRLAAALMRVNHVGEVCAQALYEGQAASTDSEWLRAEFLRAADEESDHLAWTRDRLRELESRPSVLNPVWYAGAFAIGLAAGRLGDRVSLGFMAETERQVEQHLAGHLERLPASDLRSRAIVARMQEDEVSHAAFAQQAGGIDLPYPLRAAMRLAARVMTRTAHYL